MEEAKAHPAEWASGQVWVVDIQLKAKGAERLGEITMASIERRLAILVSGEVVMAPVIKTGIPDGRVSVTLGTGDPETQGEEAERLARTLMGR